MRHLRLLGLFIFLAACSSSDDKPRTREEFCQDWAAAACSPDTVKYCQATDAAACRATQTSFCLSLVPTNFSDKAGDACIKAVGAAYKDADLTGDELNTVLALGPPCDRVVQGSKGAGESCTTTTECDAPSGLECVIKGGSPTGTCQKPESVGPGLRCSAAQQVCTAGFYCDGNNCIQAKAAGDACANDEECGTDGFCGAEGTCTAKFNVGQPCEENKQCSLGTSSGAGLCYAYGSTTKTCVDVIRLSPAEPICANLR
jgi:hypothetical protein